MLPCPLCVLIIVTWIVRQGNIPSTATQSHKTDIYNHRHRCRRQIDSCFQLSFRYKIRSRGGEPIQSWRSAVESWRGEEGKGVYRINLGRGANVDDFVHIRTGSVGVHQSGHRFGERTYWGVTGAQDAAAVETVFCTSVHCAGKTILYMWTLLIILLICTFFIQNILFMSTLDF